MADANTSSVAADAKVQPAPSSSLVLPEAEREYLWACENSGNRLGQQGFSLLSKAILAGEPAQIARFLSQGFQGSIPAVEAESRWGGDRIVVSRVAARDTPPRQLFRDDFALWLRDQAQGLSASARSANFELLSLAPDDQNDMDGGWNGRCRLRIKGKTDSGQVRETLIRFDFRLRAPSKELLPAGGWLTECSVEQVETRESQQLLMRDVTRDSGLSVDDLFDNWRDEKGHRLITTGGVYLCDFDRDGYTDVLITAERVKHNPRMYRGLPGGRFQDVTYRVGIPDVEGATQVLLADINNDGWEDLIFLGQGVFVNRQGKIFQNVTQVSNLSQLIQSKGLGGVSGASVGDFDRDGLIDIYVTRADTHEHKSGSWIDGKSGNLRGNQLLHNLGAGQFEDVTETSGTSGSRRSAFTAAWLDANHDGWPDLYVIHEFGAGVLLLNQQDGKFLEQQLVDASQDFGSMGLAVGDIDNNGGIDLYVSNMYSKAGNRVMDNLLSDALDAETKKKLRRMVSGSELHVSEGDLRYNSIGVQAGVDDVGWSWGTALVDLNNDGLLDIHSMAGFMSYDRGKPDG